MVLNRRSHRPAADGAGPDMRRNAVLGVLLLAVSAVVSGTTVWLLPLPRHDRVDVATGSAVLALVAVATLALPWPRLSRSALLLYPALSLLHLSAMQLRSEQVGTTYVGFVLFAFVYIGFVGSTRSVLVLLPFAAATWLLVADTYRVGLTAQVGIRLVIAVSVWATVGYGLVRQSSAERRRRSRLVDDAYTDVLTGLDNRRSLDLALRDVHYGDVVVVVDIDGFREVNTARGHGGGDTVLAEFGRIARVGLRGNDRAIRQGGDEFVFVLAEVRPVQVLSVLSRLRDQWQALCGPVTFSAGAATPRPGESGRDALRRADRHCYEARAAGRDQWVLDDADAADSGTSSTSEPARAVDVPVPVPHA